VRVQLYDLFWRRGRLNGTIVVEGEVGTVTARQAIALAQIQDTRMKVL
jgi:hypothetical protein